MARSGAMRPQRGFTLVELVVVIILIGVLAAVGLPRMTVALQARGDAYRDSVVAGLRLAQSTAASHRRLVCASIDAQGSLRLRIAAVHGASSCTNDLTGPDGQAVWVAAPNGVTVSGSPGLQLYFQPAGAVSSTAAGAATDFSLTPTGQTAITVRGAHGLVQ